MARTSDPCMLICLSFNACDSRRGERLFNYLGREEARAFSGPEACKDRLRFSTLLQTDHESSGNVCLFHWIPLRNFN
jgi:hypothetical protein